MLASVRALTGLILSLAVGLVAGPWAAGQDLPPGFDFTSLAHPEISEFLQLDDTQRTQVAGFVAEQATKLAAAAEADRPAVIQEYGEKIKGLLRPDQLARLEQIPELRKLEFNFGSQNWEDVLRWFARQADLSLVMSSAPAGNFNYADSNRYTPSQAINLLNSILLTKGYTLIRRDKLLILVELAGGIPDELLPQITLSELEQRGSFEIVSVMFSLGDKPAEKVQAEVKPILGSYGKMALLPQSNQLLVTETVGKIKAINTLIQSIPSPTPPAKPPQPEAAPPPVLASYPLGSLDFEATAAVVKSIAPNLVISGGPASQKIIAYGPPAQQELLKNLLEQLNSGTPIPEQTPHLKVYQVEQPVDPKLVTEQLALVVPNAKVAVAADGLRILVYATETQQQDVARALEQMDVVAATDGATQVRLFTLHRADPAVAAEMAQAVSPRAKATLDTASRTLVVRAAPAELEIIAQLVDQLEGPASAPSGLELKSYVIRGSDPAAAVTTLQPLAPSAKISIDPSQDRLMVWATPSEHETLTAAIENLFSQPAGEAANLTAIPLDGLDPTTATTLLKALVPRATVSVDATAQQLLVIGHAADQAAVQKVVSQLREGLQHQSGPTIKFYALAAGQAATAIELLGQLVPAAKVKYDSSSRQLSAIATAREHERIETALADLQAGMSPASPPKLAVYPLAADLRPRLQAVLAAAATDLGEIKIVEDQRPGELAVLATPPQHEMLTKIIAEITQPVEGVEAFVLKAYGVGSSEPAQVVQFLTPLFPGAKIVADDNALRVLIWAQPAIHQEIERVLQEFAPADEQAGTNAQALRSYKLTNLKPTAAISLLQQLLPRMQLVGNDEQGVLLAWGRERDHAKLKLAVEQLALPDDPKRLSVQVYRTENIDPQIAALVVGRILPEAIAVPNAAGQILAVLARQDQQALVREALDQMGQFNLASGPLSAMVYRVDRTGSSAIVAALSPIFPQAKLFAGATTTQVVALANAADHAQIRATIERLENDSATQGVTLRVYHLRPELASQVRPLISSALPTLKTLGSDPAVLAVFGKSEEQAVVQQLIEQAEQQLVASPKQLQAYRLKQMSPAQVRAALSEKLPTLSYVELGGDPQVLYVLGTSEEHSAAGKLLDELETTFVQRPAAVVATYPVPEVDLTQLVSLLPADLTAQATIKSDPVNKLLIVSASEPIQVQLQAAIDELQSKLPKLDQPVPRIYPLSGIRPADWTTLLAAVAPGAVTAADPNSGSLVVVGNRQTHETLERLLAGIATAAQAGKVARPYRISKADVTVASTAISALVPQAEVSVDKASRTLIVVAKEEDQQQVAQALQEIDLHAPNAARSQVYAVPSGDAPALSTALKSLIPSATYVADSSGKALLVLATEEEHQQLQTTIDQWARDPARAVSTKIYPLGGMAAKDWQAVLVQLAPGSVAAADPASNSLIVVGTSETHAKVAQLMDEFKALASQGKLARSYRISRADVTVAAEAITSLVPQAKVTVDKTARSLIVVGTEADQAIAAATLEQIDLHAPGAAIAKVYAVPTGEGGDLATALKSLVPTAAFVADKQGKSLLAFASPEEQTQIQAAVEQWTADPSRVLTTQVYKLQVADPASALPVLQKLLPSATLSADPATRSIAATASAEQHRSIATALSELDSAVEAAETRVYSAGGLTARDWQALLTQLAPGTVSAVDPDSGSLVVLARPQTHAQIRQLVEQFRDSVSTGKSLRAYRLTQADPQSLADSISALAPLSKVSVDKSSRTLVVVASETEQAAIEQVVQQVDREMSGTAVSRIYPVPTGDAGALATALKSLVPTGTYVADAAGKSLLVIAAPHDQEILAKTVADWGGDERRVITSQVYHLQTADPTTALAALQKLIPGATLAADPGTRALLATGTAEQHALLRQAVEQLDGGAGSDGATTLKAYAVRRVPADSLAKALGDLFKKDPQVSVVADKESNALIVIARSKQHEMIQAMVAASDQELNNLEAAPQIQAYPLVNSDGEAFVATLTKMFSQERPPPQISYDDVGQQLFVMGTPAQQAVVQQLMARLTGEPQEFEMFRLSHVDPFTAESAINGLFRQESRSTAPTVQTDFDNSYLFVRASLAQMERIKDVLRKLGEDNFDQAGEADNQRLRVIQLGTDVEPVLEELKKLWPQMQSNELRIIERVPESAPADGLREQPKQPPSSFPPQSQRGQGTAPIQAVSFQRVAAAEQEPSRTPPSQAAAATEAQPATATPQDKPPVFVIPGQRELTIASTDPAAIRQLEELIRTISGPLAESRTSGNFETFPLRNAGASDVAAILNDLYEGMGENRREFGPAVVIAADDRLNMLIVHGSRNDREVLGKLASVLDSPDINDSFAINQPVIVPVKNTDAERILTILNSVYRSQLSSGGGRRQLPIPEGVSSELASMLQQINVATSGPLLTLGVDVITNSIIVLAPQQLRDQVRATIEQLDNNVEVEPGEKIEIIRLQKTNPVRIQRALDFLFNDGKK